MCSFFQPLSSVSEVLMKRRKRQNTVLDACSEEAHQSNKRGISRRQFVQNSAGAVAAGALLGNGSPGLGQRSNTNEQ
jgi:hypothetical protein